MQTHDFRSSRATQLLADGNDVQYVAAYLGHTNWKMTQRYIKTPWDLEVDGSVKQVQTQMKDDYLAQLTSTENEGGRRRDNGDYP